MLQLKLFTSNQNNTSDSYSDLNCQEHVILKKYYSSELNEFFCEHDPTGESQVVHFKYILDQYKEDIKKIKNLSINLGDNFQIKEMYNYSASYLKKIAEIHDNFTKQICSFGNVTLHRVHSLISQQHEIFRLKDLIENIRFLPDGRADYIGIGADSGREKNYLKLAKILIERNILAKNFDLNQNNLTFQFIKFIENLQNYLISFVDEAYLFIKYIYDNFLNEIAKLEGNKVDMEFINNFSLYFIHRKEFIEVSEKYNLLVNETNKLLIKITNYENVIEELKKEIAISSQERDLLLQKIKDDTNTINFLKHKNNELTTELNNSKTIYSKLILEYETASKTINEQNLTIKNSSLAIENLKRQITENFNQQILSDSKYKSEVEKNANLNIEITNLRTSLNSYLNQIDQLKAEIESKSKEIQQLKEEHESEVVCAESDNENQIRSIREEYEAVISRFEKDLLEEKKKYADLKIYYELKITESNKKYEALEAKINNNNSESNKEVANLKAYLTELQNKLNEANKKYEKFYNENTENGKKFTIQIQHYELKFKEYSDKNDAHIKRILQMEEEAQDFKLNYIKKTDVSKYDEKIADLNSTIFDLKCLNNALNKKIDELESNIPEYEKKAKILTSEKEAISIDYKNLLNLYNSLKDEGGKKRTDEDRRVIDISIRLSEISKLYEADQKKIKDFDKIMKQEREKFQQTIFILEKQVKDLNIIIEEYHKTKDYSQNELLDERKKTGLLINDKQILLEKNKTLLGLNEQLQIENAQVAILNNQIEEFRIQLHSQIKQIEILTIRLEEVEKELKYERQKNSNSNPNNSKFQELKNQFDLLFMQKEKLEKEVIEKKNKVSQMQMLNDTLNSKLEISTTELNSYKDQKNSFSNIQNQIKNYITQIEEMNKNKLSLEMEITELRNKLNKALLEIDQIKLAYDQNNILISKLKEELNESRNYEKKIDILSNSKMEIEKLKNKLEKSESEKYFSGRRSITSSTTYANNPNMKTQPETHDFMTVQKKKKIYG